MSVVELQACLARLYVDEPFRKLFFLDETTLDEYRLTPEEAAAIRGIDRSMLTFFAQSLKHKRRGRIERAYPVLFALDAVEAMRYFSRYYQLYTAKPRQSGQQDVLDFGAFVEQSVAGADHIPPYVADVVRYERLYYLVRFAPRLRRPAVAAGEEVAPTRIPGAAAVPLLRDGVEIADFAHDVAEIEERLHATSVAPDVHTLTHGPSSVAFRPSTPTSAVKMLRLNVPTRAVLDRCDGRTVAQIVSGVETALGGQDLGDAIVGVLDNLLALEVLTLDPRAARLDDELPGAYGATEMEGM